MDNRHCNYRNKVREGPPIPEKRQIENYSAPSEFWIIQFGAMLKESEDVAMQIEEKKQDFETRKQKALTEVCKRDRQSDSQI